MKVGDNLEDNRQDSERIEELSREGVAEGAPGSSGETLTQEEENLRKLEEENEKLRREIERVRNLSLKERLYDKVNVSVRTLDIFIIVMVIFGIIVIILGMR